MICSKCGKKNQDGAKFCLGCGNKLEASPPQPKYKVPEAKELNQSTDTVPIISKEDLSTRPLAIAAIVLKENGHEIPLPVKAQLLIGRADKNSGNITDIDLTGIDQNKVTSRKHACIIFSDGKYFIKDLGSMNGTFINGSRIQGNNEYPLNNGDELIFGKLIFTFKISP